MIGAKTGRHRHHFFQAQPEQRRAGEQNKSERDLRDNEAVAEALGGAIDRAGARFGLQRVGQMAAEIKPRDRHRDYDSEKHRANEADRREPAIEHDVRAERQTIRTKHLEQLSSPCARKHAEQSTDGGEKDGFDQHLPNDMLSARAHRLADRHFFRASARANQEEVDRLTAPISRRKNTPACMSRSVGRMERT